MAGIRSYLAPFFTLPKMFLRGTAAAGGIGLINAVGNLGGFVGPKMLGEIDKATGSFVGGILFLAGTSALAGTFILVLAPFLRPTLTLRRAPPAVLRWCRMPAPTNPKKQSLMPSNPLRRRLRGAGHALTPVVQLGKEGTTEAVRKQILAALADHELIKIKLGSECPQDRFEVAAWLAGENPE